MNIEVWCKDARPTPEPQRPYMSPRTMANNQPRHLIRPPSFIPKPANNPQQQIQRPVSCERCGKQGHSKQNCFRLKQQNFPIAQFGKLPPPRVNHMKETEDQEDYEITTLQKKCSTYDVVLQECYDQEDSYWIPEQESTSSNEDLAHPRK
ncbi:uncharacterized protein LOC143348858 [Colletes latitarsis]|uniref:uncharacterized protein LOC143348858 n=1 Tax=Colletes latitarsis TaxID=2605962 RepID=UPI0040363900